MRDTGCPGILRLLCHDPEGEFHGDDGILRPDSGLSPESRKLLADRLAIAMVKGSFVQTPWRSLDKRKGMIVDGVSARAILVSSDRPGHRRPSAPERVSTITAGRFQ